MKQLAAPYFDRFAVALQYPEFRHMWMANASAQAAAWGLIVARGWLVYDRTESSFIVGITTFAALAPQLIVTPIAGVLADRMDRRTILAWTYGVNSGHNALLLALAIGGVLEVWMIAALAVVNGVARAAQMPVSQAMAANLVPRESLLNALALNASTQHGSRLIGPGLVTPLLAVGGAIGGFFVCTAFYAIGWWQILKVNPRPVARTGKEQGWISNFGDGLVYVYNRPVLRFLVLMVFFHCGLTMAFESLLPKFSDQRLNASESGFGTLMMAVGLGAFFASVFIAGIQTSKARGNIMIITGLASGLGQVVLSMTTVLWAAFGAAVLMGAAQAAFMTIGQALTQSIASDEFRGRVASINAFSLGGTMATMNLMNGALAEEVGTQVLLFTQGLIFAAIIIGSLFLLTGRRVYGRAPVMEAVPA